MLKEIHEQPKAVQDTLNSVLKDGAIDLSSVGLTEEELQSFSQIYIVACGSAYHVGVACQYVLEDLAQLPGISCYPLPDKAPKVLYKFQISP